MNIPANCWRNLTNCGGMTCDGLAFRPGGVEILLATSCYRNWGYAPAAMSQSAPRLQIRSAKGSDVKPITSLNVQVHV